VAQAAESIVYAREPAGILAHAEIPRPDPARITLSVHHDLASVEQDWRRFEQTADCTPFQTFDWLSAWQRHVGAARGITPAVVIARQGEEMFLLLPLGIQRRGIARCLVFLGDVLCDYNAPLLAPDFAARAPAGCWRAPCRGPSRRRASSSRARRGSSRASAPSSPPGESCP